MAKKARSTKPIIVHRKGKTFIRKRPKTGYIYVEPIRKTRTKREREAFNDLAKKQLIWGTAGELANQAGTATMKRQVREGRNVDAFVTSVGTVGAGHLVEHKQRTWTEQQRELNHTALKRSAQKAKGFEKNKFKAGLYSGEVQTHRGAKKYKVRQKSFYARYHMGVA